jgi:hypothetical protein
MIKYFNEITSQEYTNFFNKGLTWKDIAKDYPQPVWCRFPNAVNYKDGCLGLVLQSIHAEEDCEKCFYYRKEQNGLS